VYLWCYGDLQWRDLVWAVIPIDKWALIMEQRLKLLKLGSNWCSKIMILNKQVVPSILNSVPASETFCSDWIVGSKY
jgi:hypothetical protein